ncbi:unnamed protein product [Orchesella dallaii]|uniref:Uncharacterized protein n=1 Tax=Orchesella dallaii TaxID=48710 RepID=A0ABP1S803_9HEXA
MTNELGIFCNCSLHIVTAAVPTKNPGEHAQYYLDSLSFPVVLSTFYYEPVLYERDMETKNEDVSRNEQQQPNGILCNGHTTQLKTNQTLPVLIAPQPKINCEVLVYLTPPTCKTWITNSKRTRWHSFMPRLNLKSYPGFQYNAEEIYRTGRFFILVSHMQKSLIKSINSSIFHVVDTNCDVCSPEPLYSFTTSLVLFKTKLFFEIKPLPEKNKYHIDFTYIVSRPNEYFQGEYQMAQYISQKFNNPTEIEKIESFPKSSSWKLVCPDCRPIRPKDGHIVSLKDKKLEKHPIESVLLQILSPNSTIKHSSSSLDFFLTDETTLQFPLATLIIEAVDTDMIKQVIEFQQSYYFVTCASPGENHMMRMILLVSAFDGKTWLCMGISCVGSGFALLLIMKQREEKFTKLNPVATFLFAFDLLLDHHSRLLNKCRFIGGTWLLVVIVLIAGYEGLTTGILTKPNEPEKFTSINQLILRGINIHIRSQYVWRGLNRWSNGMIKESIVMPRNQTEVVAMMQPQYLLNTLGHCEKDVFIGDYESALELYLHLKPRRCSSPIKFRHLTLSQRRFSPLPQVWLFYNVPWSADVYSKRMHSLMQSGMVELWTEWRTRVRTWALTRHATLEQKQGAVVVLSMEGNVVVVFYLYVILIGISIMWGVVETRAKAWNDIIGGINWFWKFIFWKFRR